jgi:hypothetical protein
VRQAAPRHCKDYFGFAKLEHCALEVARHWVRWLLFDRSMRVRLIRKLAEELDGIDLSEYRVGDVITLGEPAAQVLITEGWAIVERRAGGIPPVVAFRRNSDPGQWWDEDDEYRAS